MSSNPLKELKAAVLSLRLSGNPKLVRLADRIDDLLGDLDENSSPTEIASVLGSAGEQLEGVLDAMIDCIGEDFSDVEVDYGTDEVFDIDDEMDAEVLQALSDIAGGGWEPDEYVAVVKSFSGAPINGVVAEQLIAAFAAQAQAAIGTFEVVDRNSVGNELYLRVRFDLDRVREFTGAVNTRRVITDVLSAGEVPGLGLVMCTDVVPVVPADVSATQRRGAVALRDLREQGRI